MKPTIHMTISRLALLFLIANPCNIGCDADHQATDESAQCSGLCELCVAFVPSPQKGKPQIVFRDSLNTKDGASAACGSFDNKIMTEGWGYLHVRTNEKVADDQQAWAAGFVEGYLTQEQIHNFHTNTATTRTADMTSKINNFIERQRKYIASEIDKHDRPGDQEFLFWHNINLISKQLAGLYAGYKAKVRKRGVESTEALTMAALWTINMDGDIIQLESAFKKGFLSQTAQMAFRETSRESMISARKAASTSEHWKNLLLKSLSHQYDYTAAEKTALARSIEADWKKKVLKQRCTALVRLADNNNDLMVAHTSWEDYNEMLRIFKHFDTRFQGDKKGQQVSFSSYPGMLSSTDDYYVTGNKLLVTETTISIMNDNVLLKMKPEGVGSWMNTMVASRLAKSGEEWARLFMTHSARTYSCQWMIVDYNLFKKGSPTQSKGLFWILEDVPSAFVSKDMTEHLLKHRYWQSANRPYFDNIRESSGYTEGVALTSFNENPRAKIFARLQGKVNSVEDMKSIIRYNGYPNEAASKGDPSLTIAARYDLAPGSRQLTGAVDGKVVSAADVESMSVHAISGPSTENEPPFTFKPSDQHDGMPDTFNFGWVVTRGGVIGGGQSKARGSGPVSWGCQCISPM